MSLPVAVFSTLGISLIWSMDFTTEIREIPRVAQEAATSLLGGHSEMTLLHQ